MCRYCGRDRESCSCSEDLRGLVMVRKSRVDGLEKGYRILQQALLDIKAVRDGMADDPEALPPWNEEQCFDDWAADLASEALMRARQAREI